MATIPWKQVQDVVDAALALPPEARIPYLDHACAEPILRRYVDSLVHSYEQAGTFLNEAAAVRYGAVLVEPAGGSRKGQRIGAYQIIEQIGEGGMGEVYRAVRADDQYQKQVAIKLVRGGFNSNFTWSRFRTERQILANLDHPNITRLLDGGATEEGQPYLVMEYVQGLPLDEYCDRNKLTVSERLMLFRTICGAVHYAHQNLVIHRDLKPGNILVTEDGTPKLLDFGIAKMLDNPDGAAAARTLTLVRLLTPEYASPEQLRGETITTSSDVYSLGAVLYELLTGHRPHRLVSRQPDQVAKVVTETEPVKPSMVIRGIEEDINTEDHPRATPETVSAVREGSVEKLRRRLAGDLDNIVLMALRKEPQRRYSSVEQFSEDIRRHLEGAPVRARTSTFTYRSGKFIKRHRAAVGAAALVGLSLAVGLAVALREANIARTQQRRAERRFNDVRELANSLMFDIHDAIEVLPGSTAARKLLVDRALKYLDSLAQEAQTDVSLQRELADAYERVGDVQGYPYRANLGDTPGAIASYRKALRIRKSLADRLPAGLPDACALATAYRLLGETLLMSGDAQGALENTRAALAITERLARTEPANVKVLTELQDDYETAGDIEGGNVNSSNLSDVNEAMESYQKGGAVSDTLARLNPSDTRARRLLGIFNLKIGDTALFSGRRGESLEYYQKALQRFQELAKSATSAQAQREVGSTYGRIANLVEMDGDFKGSLYNYRQTLRIDQELAAADPSNAQAQVDLLLTYISIGELLCRIGQRSEGFQLMTKALSMAGALVRQTPTNAEFRGVLGLVCVTMGERFADAHNYSDALDAYRKAIGAYEKLASDDPQNSDARLSLAATYAKMAALMANNGNATEAADFYEKSLSSATPLADAHPNIQSLYTVADAYSGLADLSMIRAAIAGQAATQRRQHWLEARAYYLKSLDAWHRIQSPARISPSGFDAGDPREVSRNLARCDAALARSQARTAQY